MWVIDVFPYDIYIQMIWRMALLDSRVSIFNKCIYGYLIVNLVCWQL